MAGCGGCWSQLGQGEARGACRALPAGDKAHGGAPPRTVTIGERAHTRGRRLDQVPMQRMDTLTFSKARIADAEALARASKAAFDGDIHYGAPVPGDETVKRQS